MMAFAVICELRGYTKLFTGMLGYWVNCDRIGATPRYLQMYVLGCWVNCDKIETAFVGNVVN